MAILGAVVDFAVHVLASLGYPGLFLLMTAESMVLPIPSEAVMPFAGFLIVDGVFTWPGVLLAAFAGSIVGSVLSYYIGLRGGRPFIVKYGRFLLVSHKELDWTDRFFARYGASAILLARFIPVVRHLISIPAGVARMRLAPFLAATAVGAFAWNFILAYAGTQLGPQWPLIRSALEPYELALVALGVLLVAGWFAYKLREQKRAAEADGS